MSIENKAVAIAVLAVAALWDLSANAELAPHPEAEHEVTKCGGINSCKGMSSCASAHNACRGQNACKGKGWVETKSEKECKDKGGTVITDKKK